MTVGHTARVIVRLVACLLGLALLTPGCASRDKNLDGNRGECTGAVRFHGRLYVSDSRLNQAASHGRSIGRGVVVDCDRRTVVDRVMVSTVEGAESGLAIRV